MSSDIVDVALFAVVMTLASVGIAALVLVRLPVDYLCDSRPLPPPAGPRDARFWLRAMGRNIAGALLVAIGVLLSVPGVPGQGVLVVIAGLLLIDFPGKRRLVGRVLRRAPVLRAVNGLRAWCSQPPLEGRHRPVDHPSSSSTIDPPS